MIDEIRFEIAQLRRLYIHTRYLGTPVTPNDLASIIEGLERVIDPTTPRNAEERERLLKAQRYLGRLAQTEGE